MTEHLLSNQGLTEHDPPFEVLYGFINNLFCADIRQRQHGKPFMLKLHHLVDKPFAFRSDEILRRNPHLIKI